MEILDNIERNVKNDLKKTIKKIVKFQLLQHVFPYMLIRS